MDEENTNQEITENQEDIPEIPEDWAYPKIYQPIITLGDGTELKGLITKPSFTNKIWIMLNDAVFSYNQIITMFNNPENTRMIRCSSSPSERIEYIGYTYLSSINAEPDGKFNIGLSKPEF